jgi:hypothetical protein
MGMMGLEVWVMWRWVTRGLVLAALFTFSVPAVSAQGFAGFVDRPVESAVVSGVVVVEGWALDQDVISRIDLFVDDEFQHSARLNLPRIDVVRSYPDWEGIQSRLPGFHAAFLASRFSNGPHTIHLEVVTSDGRTHEIGRRTIVIDNTINQAPFGFVETPGTDAIYDVNGAFPVAGWAADVDGIHRIDVLIDGLTIQSAVYGDPRPDVGNFFPDFPAASFSGFVAHVNSTRIQDGVHVLTVVATDRKGLSRTIGRRNIQVFNSSMNLRPFGYLDNPHRDAVLYGNCITAAPPISPMPANPRNHITPVTGWVLDLGTVERTGRVSYVELLVDDVVWYSTDMCSYNTEFGGFINCYGLPRYDIARYYPTFPDSPRSGFLVTLDVATLMSFGVRPGHHSLKIRAGDMEQTFADIPHSDGIPVFFTCTTSENYDFASMGYIDYPHHPDLIGGMVTFHGWALDENGGVASVQIIVDGHVMGTAQYGLPRPDVRQVYPFISGSGTSGWQFTLDTTKLSNAKHRLTVRVFDAAGNPPSEIGSIDFYVANP